MLVNNPDLILQVQRFQNILLVKVLAWDTVFNLDKLEYVIYIFAPVKSSIFKYTCKLFEICNAFEYEPQGKNFELLNKFYLA